MSKITLNFDGDVNIFVNEKNGMLESLLLDGLSDYPDDTLEIDLDVDLEDADANATALYALPWQLLAAPATLYEILSQLISCCDLDSMEPMPLEDTFMHSLAVRKGADYDTGRNRSVSEVSEHNGIGQRVYRPPD